MCAALAFLAVVVSPLLLEGRVANTKDPVPDFALSVNLSSKSITVTAKHGKPMYARLCYKANPFACSGDPEAPPVTIDPSKSPSLQLTLPYLLPCLCVEVYYKHTDATRNRTCPFQKEKNADISDVWLSSEVVLYGSTLTILSHCYASDLPGNISASLCWMQTEHVCTPIANSSLQDNGDNIEVPVSLGQLVAIGDGFLMRTNKAFSSMCRVSWQEYNTSAVDKHPRMCVVFSLQGSHNISCPFEADMSSWEVHIERGRRGVIVNVDSELPATFSAQFCVLNKTGCTPTGPVRTLRGKSTQISVAPTSIAEKPCVQVWQSDPALKGKRILCPDYTHNRWGMYAVAALMFVVVVASLGMFIHRLTRSGAAGWLYIQKPVLLVCSSDHSAHVSAVCALASILQGELSAKVHMALWAQSSQRQTRAGTAVADLGPIPWLYGQWEAVRKAQGKMLIIWSPEAKRIYEKWSEERTAVDTSGKKAGDNSRAELRYEKIKADEEAHDERLEKCKKDGATEKKDCDKDWYPQKEASSVTGPVFAAALACLEGALQHSKHLGVAIVYFQGLGHSRDIPKALRAVPRYCLPQGFSGLIQELGGMTRLAKNDTFTWHCWPRLLSKVLSIWLAKELANRLQTLLPQSEGMSDTSPQEGKTQSELEWPPEADVARTGPAPEREPLHESPPRAERL